jgi:hypothetical protein
MADDEKKPLPKMTTKNWWALRRKLRSSVPSKITPTFVAATLGIKEASASVNVIPPLKQMGLIDENQKPTGLAFDWRDDDKYPDACEKIRVDTYPQELLDLAPSADIDRAIVQSWIASHFRVGTEAARQVASVYMLLLEADPTKELAASPNLQQKVKSQAQPKKPTTKAVGPQLLEDLSKAAPVVNQPSLKLPSGAPSLHIDIQVHISPESSPEQIDKIFASMAKHLKDFNKN